MSDRWPGGIIRKTPVVPTGPNYNGAASGVWTMDQAAYWQRQGLWPTQGVGVPDPSFPYVTMLLSTTSLNGAQNNTFLDSSANNFTITRVGNPTQGSVNPYGANWSNYFDGSGDYLSAPSNAAFDLGSSDFTVECWFNANSFATGFGLISRYNYSGVGLGWGLIINSATSIRFLRGNDILLDSTVSAMSVGTWYHVASVRSGSTLTVYLNGVQIGQATGISNFSDASTALQIGRTNTVTNDINGYISNARVVKGTAVYTSAFTPPTAPLTAISGTSILTCQSNRFLDASANNFTITRNGNTSVSVFSPFSPSAAYSTTNGGSSYLPGGANNITAASNAAFGFGSGDFTVEFWFYYASGSLPSDARYVSFGGSGGCLNITQYSGGIGVVNEAVAHILTSTTNFDVGAWNHLAFTRSGSTLRLFKNGVQFATTTSSAGNSTGEFYLLGAGLTGYFSSARVVKGTALYTSNFTPNTTPLTAISGTSILLNGTNAGIFDAATINDMETVGNAQVSTAVSKFGGSSMAFDGTGDYLLTPSNPAYGLASSNFTIEAWVYVTSSSEPYQPVVKAVGSGSNNLMFIDYSGGSTGVLSSQSGGTAATRSGVTLNTWHHLAVVRNGTSVTCYVNGVGGTSQTIDPGSSGSVSLLVGYDGGTSPARYFNGYIDDLRITKGVARYTANFTPPTQAFPPY